MREKRSTHDARQQAQDNLLRQLKLFLKVPEQGSCAFRRLSNCAWWDHIALAPFKQVSDVKVCVGEMYASCDKLNPTNTSTEVLDSQRPGLGVARTPAAGRSSVRKRILSSGGNVHFEGVLDKQHRVNVLENAQVGMVLTS